MDTQVTYPQVRSVTPLAGKRLLVAFATGEERFYDCGPWLAESGFAALADETVFQQVRADPHGYGVLWNDEIDLAESELWINGTSAEPDAPANAG
jgi:hypothetical protein